MKLYDYFFSVKNLLVELTKREIKERYRGSFLGLWWSMITPMAMLFVFTFVFGEIFQAKWHGGGSVVQFGLNLYAGLIVFWFFAEVIGRAPSLIASQPNFVKKVIFPLELLSLVSLLSSLFHFCINATILCVATLLVNGSLPLSALSLPFAALACMPLLLGLSWMLSSIGVYVRDIASIIGVAMNMLMFLSPIFYPLEAISAKFRWLFELNPMSFIIEWVRECVMSGVYPHGGTLLIYSFMSLLTCFAGYRCFTLLRKGFADVL